MPEPGSAGVPPAPPGEAGPLVDESFVASVLHSERVFDGAVWDIRRDRFRLGDTELVREYQDHPGAVAVLAVDEWDRVLLIKQYRHPIGHRDWELPAGLLDVHGESELAAAQRELAEEADLEAEEWTLLTRFYTSPGGSSELVTVYRASVLRTTHDSFARVDEEAELELRWASLNEVVTAILDGRLRNAILNVAALTAHARR